MIVHVTIFDGSLGCDCCMDDGLFYGDNEISFVEVLH